MLPYPLIIILLIIVSYAIGCFSTARLIAKNFKGLNIYKVGTGHPDTENIYQNVSKTLGVLVGIVDMGKIYIYLQLIKLIFGRLAIEIIDPKLLMVYGFAMILGHCLPVTNKFKGGRGLFSFIGFVSFFAFIPMLIVAVLAMIVILAFKQIRFAQYMIVLLPPFVSYFIPGYSGYFSSFLVFSVLMGIVNFFVSKNLGEI
ncbi:MAG: glycerol-3-phosphate acyltransferase [Candidatus Cloacimonas sp.]|nr:glycerol-3-phosphate acyltransferase [Candidatus Cloacimonadota bacterium]